MDPREELRRIVRAQLETSKQIKILGKNLLDLSQLVQAQLCRDKQSSPIDSASTDFTTSLPSSEATKSTQGLVALLVDGDYRYEWANLSNSLFNLGIAQASVIGDLSIISATGFEPMARFDLIFMPYSMNQEQARLIQRFIREVNYHAIFIAVSGSLAPPRNDPNPWFSEVITADASMGQIGDLVNRLYHPLDHSMI